MAQCAPLGQPADPRCFRDTHWRWAVIPGLASACARDAKFQTCSACCASADALPARLLALADVSRGAGGRHALWEGGGVPCKPLLAAPLPPAAAAAATRSLGLSREPGDHRLRHLQAPVRPALCRAPSLHQHVWYPKVAAACRCARVRAEIGPSEGTAPPPARQPTTADAPAGPDGSRAGRAVQGACQHALLVTWGRACPAGVDQGIKWGERRQAAGQARMTPAVDVGVSGADIHRLSAGCRAGQA